MSPSITIFKHIQPRQNPGSVVILILDEAGNQVARILPRPGEPKEAGEGRMLDAAADGGAVMLSYDGDTGELASIATPEGEIYLAEFVRRWREEHGR